jgi:hypothetical protein
LLLLQLHFLDQLLLFLYLRLLVALDGLAELHAVVSYDQPLVLLVLLQLISHLLQLLFFLFLHLSHLLLSVFQLVSLLLVSPLVEGVRFEEVELVASGEHRGLEDGVDLSLLVAFDFGELVQGPASLLDARLQVTEVLKLKLKIECFCAFLFHSRRMLD